MSMQISISNAIGGGGGSQGGTPTPPTPPSFADTKSFQFDGITDYINTNTTIVGTTFSISAWFKVANTTDLQPIVSTRENSISTSKGIDVYIQSDTLTFRVYRNGGTSVTQSFTDLGWNHVLYVYNGTTLEGFLNGISIGSAIGTYATSTQTLKTGIFVPSSEYAETYIDEVALFYTDESANVSTIFNGGVPNDLTALNPILWYRMGEEATWNGSKFVLDNQGSIGGTATSIGLNASDPNPTTDVPLFDNKSFTYDGNLDYINIGNDASLQPSNFTMCVWVKPNTNNSNRALIHNGAGLYGNSNHGFFLQQSYTNYYFKIGDGTTSYTSFNGGLVANTWQFVAMTYDGVNMKTYLDGILQDTLAVPNITYGTSATWNPFYIGRTSGGSQYMDGNLNDASLFNTALNNTDILTIFNGGLPNDISALSPLGYWRAEQVTFDGTDWTLIDQGSGGNNGTSVSMPLTARTSDVPLFDNKSFAYDGNLDYVDMSNPSNLNFDADNPFTFSVWFKRSSDTNAVALFDKSLGAPNNNGYICFIYNNKVYFRIRQNASLQHQINNNNTHPFNTWVHYIITYNGSRGGSASGLNLYEDGVLQTNVLRTGNFATGTAQTSANFSIGSRQSTSDLNFNGTINDTSLFNSELTQANVTEIYNGGISNDISNLNPLGYWRSEFANWDGSNWTMIDQGSGANNGLTSSMPLTSRTSDVPT